MPFKVTSPVEISDELIENILTCAVEGGINYWCQKARTMSRPDEKWVRLTKEKDPICAGCIDWLETIRTTGVRFYDSEEPSKGYPLKGDRAIQSGIEAMIAKHPKHFANMISESYDAITGDVFLQCCLFGDTIYA